MLGHISCLAPIQHDSEQHALRLASRGTRVASPAMHIAAKSSPLAGVESKKIRYRQCCMPSKQ
jgi:hypothetical protein